MHLGRILRNILSNWAGGLVAAAISFVLTPVIIDGLKLPDGGNQAYGVWTFIVAFTAYFALADLGFYQGVLQYFTRHRAREEAEQVNRVVSTGAAALGLASLLAALIAAGLATVFPQWVEGAGLAPESVRLAFLIMALAIAIKVPTDLGMAVLTGCEAFHLHNAVLIVTRLANAALVVWLLDAGAGIVGLAVATASTETAGQLARVVLAFRLVPGMRVRPADVSRRTLTELFDYGRWMFLTRIGDMHLANVDLLIVPFVFGPEAMAVYGLAVSFATFAQVPMKGYAFVLIPTAISADATGEGWRTRALLVKGSRIGLLFGGMFLVGFHFWGAAFIRQWIGDPTFLEEARFVSAATVLSIVAIDRVLLQGLIGPPQVLLGARRVRDLAKIEIGQGLAALVLGSIAAMVVGIVAVPWTLAAVAICGRSVLTLRACRVAEVPVADFIRQALLPPAASLVVMAAGCWAVRRWIAGEGWGELALAIALSGLVGIAAGWAIALSAEERRDLLAALRQSSSRSS